MKNVLTLSTCVQQKLRHLENCFLKKYKFFILEHVKIETCCWSTDRTSELQIYNSCSLW